MLKKIEGIIAEQRQTAKELESIKSKIAGSAADSILSNAVDVKGYKLVCAEIKDADGNELKTMGDQLKNKLGSGVIVLASTIDGKVNLLAMATDDAVKAGAHAGNIIKAAAAVCGGGGGGRPNMAQAGGKDASKITEALTKAKEVLAEQL
ncbi:Alanine--tRNA ligase [bioreactor metagenome]|uniref:Alanine--tRNA ligase n=1 Tax=bioreactor metagenome TaxID=1076179 RepID=A0A645E4G2_9ZZZZ